MRRRACGRRAGCLAALGVAIAGNALGATLSSQSSVGLSSDYASNPFLQVAGSQSAEALGLIANLPATYSSDTTTIDLEPRLRLAQPYGPVALLSNYEYLDADWHWRSERNTFAASADLHHDSTYYDQFEQAALLGHDLQRREEIGNLSWDRALSERSDLQLSGSFDEVAYSQRAASSVTDYRYSQGALQYTRVLNERWQWASSIGYGYFQLLDGSYGSDERFAQTSLSRSLSERWSLLTQVGYAYVTARGLSYTCCQLAVSPSGSLYLAPIPVEQYASRGSPNFLLTGERRGERLVLDLTASRAIQPSGFGALLTRDSIAVTASYPWTERLTFTGGLQWSRLSDLLDRLALEDLHYYDGNLSASWLWTEHWTVQLSVAYARQYIAPQLPGAAGTTVSLNLSRQFGRLRL